MKNYRIIVIAEKGNLSKESLEVLKQQAEIYIAKGIQDAFSHLTFFSYHLIVVEVKKEVEIVCQLVETICEVTTTPIIVLLPQYSIIRRKEIIYAGADAVLEKPYTLEEINLQAYALIRRYMRMETPKLSKKYIKIGGLTIDIFRRSVWWKQEEIVTVKREFDFLCLLASTPERVYTYSQIYCIVWKEYPQGDITNIVYCMVYRLKQKLRKVDIKAADIIYSVKEVGYCLKIDGE